MKKIIAILLIATGVLAGYTGLEKLNKSETGFKIGELEIKAQDSGAKNTGYAYLGIAIICIIGGVVNASRK